MWREDNGLNSAHLHGFGFHASADGWAYLCGPNKAQLFDDKRADTLSAQRKFSDFALAISQAIQAIQAERGWVDVNDPIRKPEHDQEYLICLGSTCLTAFWNARTQEWDSYGIGDAQWHQMLPTHWMPLPALPRDK